MTLFNFGKIKRGLFLIWEASEYHRVRIMWMTILGLLAGLFGGLGISVVIPLFSILGGQPGADSNTISNLFQSVLSTLHIPLNAPVLITLMIALFVCKAFVQFLAKYISEKTAAIYEENTRSRLFNETMHMDWPSIMRYKSGYLERVLLNDIGLAGAVISSIGSFMVLIASFSVYAVIAFGISPIISFLTLVFGVFAFIVLKPLLYRIRTMVSVMAENEKSVSHQINDGVVGAKTIKSYAVEDQIIRYAINFFIRLKDARIRLSFFRNALGQFGEPAGMIFVGILFLITFKTAGFDIASFAVAVYLIQKMFNSIQNAQSQFNALNETVPYLRIIRNYHKNALEHREHTESESFAGIMNGIEFNNVHFSYNETEILSGIHFKIDKNSNVGLIGPSGVGKTTIADLTMRLVLPQKGEITVDGRPISDFALADWRRNIGYVPQDNFFLNDTVRNNIRFFDDQISDKDIEEAARAANIYDVVVDFEKGFDTMMGERGQRLSAGQRQRIALARALAKKPQLLILDEATSALDNESELAIQETIGRLQGKVTLLTIAHRLSTIRGSDKLLVLQDGHIVEEGRPEDLLRDKDSRFYRLYHIRD